MKPFRPRKATMKYTNLKQSLLACVLPKSDSKKTPVAVSLVENPCDTATNYLKIIYNKPKHVDNVKKKKKRFIVCSKGHTFPQVDKSIQITEYIEILRSLGADVSIYHYDIQPNISKASFNLKLLSTVASR